MLECNKKFYIFLKEYKRDNDPKLLNSCSQTYAQCVDQFFFLCQWRT